MEKQDARHFDAIIIGSGMGGLTTASLLAQLRNQRVLVLERHYTPGGFTHTFARPGGYRWDVGVHYCGELHEGGLTHKLNCLIAKGRLHWEKMPDPYDKFVYPDFTFGTPVGKDRYRAALTELFPEEAEAIAQYFEDLKTVSRWASRNYMADLLPGELGALGKDINRAVGEALALQTTGEYLNARFRNERLKSLLASQWGDYGLPPRESAFVMHAVLVRHYMKGAYYPRGGSAAIAESIIPIIEEHGGQVLINHPVQQILVENGLAVGVRVALKKGNETEEVDFYAPVVVSNAGAYATYLQLLPRQLTGSIPQQLQALRPPPTAHVSLYLGLKTDPRTLGFQGENHWIFSGYDHNALFAQRNEIPKDVAGAVYLSFPSLKDPEAERHTAEVISFMGYELFEKWKNARWKKRGKEYEELKNHISRAMLASVEKHYPGFAELIDYQELSTPLSTEHFTGHYRGNIYGVPCRPERFRLNWLNAQTPVPNVYLTGADAVSPGVMGALMGGVFAAAHIMGGVTGMAEIMLAAEHASGADPFAPLAKLASIFHLQTDNLRKHWEFWTQG